MTREMPSTSSTATSGRVVTSRFVKIASRARLVASVVEVDSLAAVEVSEAALAPEEVSALAAVSEAALVVVEATQEAVAVALAVVHRVVVQVSSRALAQTRLTPSLTSLLLAPSLAARSTSVTCHGQLATRILLNFSPRLEKLSAPRFSTSQMAAHAELVSSNLRSSEMLKLRLVCASLSPH
jgi:hypothetical protein